MARLRSGMVAAACAALWACSGGGGDGGGGGGGLDGISVTPSALTFVAGRGGSLPAAQLVTIRFGSDVAVVAAGWPAGTTGPTWLAMSLSGAGNLRYLSVYPDETYLSLGTHTATIRIACFRADSSLVGYRDIAVTFHVRKIAPWPQAVSSSYVIGGTDAPAAATVIVEGEGGTAWTASESLGWLSLSSSSGVVGGSTTLTFDPTGLATGTHRGTVTFAGGGDTATLDVTLSVTMPALTVTPDATQLAGASGHDLSPKTLSVSIDTGTNAFPWTAAAEADWVELSPTAGTASSSPAAITLRPSAEAAGRAPGTWSTPVTVTAEVNGNTLTKTVWVHYRLDEHRLRVSEEGVAFASTPGLSSLSRTLVVDTNRGLPASWSASSDQDWLSLAATVGAAGDPLVLTADPSGLASDAVHEATVTVTTDDAGLANVETVRVGLWVGEVTPEAVTTLAAGYEEIVADPVRPYVYVHAGGTDVKVYNTYTGAEVATIPALGAALGAMSVSGDGTRLFVVDRGATPREIVPVELPSRTVATAWSLPAWASSPRLAYARTNGARLVLTSNGTVHDAATGAQYSPTFGSQSDPSATVATSRNGSRVCALNLGISPYTVRCFALDFTTLGLPSPLVIGAARFGPWNVGGNGQDVAVSADGSRAYVASGSPYTFTVYDAAGSMAVLDQLPGSPYPTAIEVGWDDRIYCGAATGGTSTWIYDGAGALQSSLALGAPLPRGFAVSGDGLRMAVINDGLYTSGPLKLVTVAP